MAECHLERAQSAFLAQNGGETCQLHLVPVFGTHPRQAGVFNDPPVEKLHDVESGADDRVILTQTVGFGDGYVGVFQGVQDSILAVDLVRRLGQQLSRGFLPQDIFLVVTGSQHVGRIRLAIAELEPGKSLGRKCLASLSRDGIIIYSYLLYIQRSFDLWHIAVNVLLERFDIDWLSYGACHYESRLLQDKSIRLLRR